MVAVGLPVAVLPVLPEALPGFVLMSTMVASRYFEGSGVDDHFLGFGELFTVGEDPFLAVDEVHVVAEVAEGDLEEFEFVLGHDGEATRYG